MHKADNLSRPPLHSIVAFKPSPLLPLYIVCLKSTRREGRRKESVEGVEQCMCVVWVEREWPPGYILLIAPNSAHFLLFQLQMLFSDKILLKVSAGQRTAHGEEVGSLDEAGRL